MTLMEILAHKSSFRSKLRGIQPLVIQKKKPLLIMTMGGPGSGKSSAELTAQVRCGKDFATASLDDFRKDSDLYNLLIAAGHHGDDYEAVEPFANALRTWVANYAKDYIKEGEGERYKYNLLYDGSGIEFAPRYRDDVVRKFKEKGYEVHIIGAERDINTAFDAIIERARKPNGRTMPWRAILEKHSKFPESFMQAMEEKTVDKITLFNLDNRTDFSKDYLMAESYLLNDAEAQQLADRQEQGILAKHLKNLIFTHPTSFLKSIAGKTIEKEGKQKTLPELDALAGRINGFKDDTNVTYRIYHVAKDVNRVLVVYDAKRFEKMMRKSTLNTEASNRKEMDKPSELQKFLPNGSWTMAIGLNDKGTSATFGV